MSKEIPLWLFNLPNRLTFFRAASTPIIIIFMLQDQIDHYKLPYANPRFFDVAAGILFGISALTDFFDGWLARRYNIESLIGKLLDPIADKVLTVSTLIILVEKHRLAGWFVVLLVLRDFGITSIRVQALEEGIAIPSHITGKIKTVLMDFGITCLIIYGQLGSWFSFRLLGLFLMACTFFFSFYSAYLYIKLYYQALKKSV